MAFSMSDIHKGIKKMPRKVIIYGPPKMGKSTLAGSTKNALMIPTEDRVAHIDCDKTPVIKEFSEIFEIFDFLLEGKHNYKRLIIDSLDWLEPLLHKYLCDKNGYKTLSDDSNKETNYGKGLKYVAVGGWKTVLHNCDVLRDAGMDVIIVAHDTVITVTPPDMDNYDKAVMKIDKNALSVIEEWADIIAYYSKEIFTTEQKAGAKSQKKAVTSNKRILHLSGESPAMINGNSFGLPNAEVDIDCCSDIMEWMLTENKNKKLQTKTKGE